MWHKDPQNRAVSDALAQADRIGRIQLAATEASKEIEQTKKEIQSLKQAPAPPSKEPQKDAAPKPPADTSLTAKSPPASRPLPAEADKEQNLAKLEDKLAKLTEQLLQFEAMKQQVEEGAAKVRAVMNTDDVEGIRKATDDLMQVVQQVGAAAYQQAGSAQGAPGDGRDRRSRDRRGIPCEAARTERFDPGCL